MKRKYFIFSTAAGCTSNLWESAVYDDYLKSNDMDRVYDADDADVIVVNTCSVTPSFEDQSEKYIEKITARQLGLSPDKKIVIAGCYSAIRQEKLDEKYSNPAITHMKPIEIEKMRTSLDLGEKKEFLPMETMRFDDIKNCHSTKAHKIVWFGRKAVKAFYKLLKIKESYLLNFLDSMIFNDSFHVIEVGHGCAGGCTFCSIKQSRGFVYSREEQTVLETLETGLKQGATDFWLLATDIGAWGLDRKKNPGDLLAPIYNKTEDFRIVLNYIEPQWLLRHENIHQYLCDKKSISVAVPIQSGSSRLVQHSGRQYDPQNVVDCIKSIKKLNPNLIVKTNIMVGLPSETWHDFYTSVKAVFSFDVIVPVVFGLRPGTRAENEKEIISGPVKFFRFFIICAVAVLWQLYLCTKSFVGDLLRFVTGRR